MTLLAGTQSNGMGHETAYAQIAADLLGLPIEAFRYVQADTARVRAGNGHGGARSMHMGGAALCKAVDAMLAKGRAIAARLLQSSVEQMVFVDGRFAVRGEPDRAIDLLGVSTRELQLTGTLAHVCDGICRRRSTSHRPEWLPRRRSGDRSRPVPRR